VLQKFYIVYKPSYPFAVLPRHYQKAIMLGTARFCLGELLPFRIITLSHNQFQVSFIIQQVCFFPGWLVRLYTFIICLMHLSVLLVYPNKSLAYIGPKLT